MYFHYVHRIPFTFYSKKTKTRFQHRRKKIISLVKIFLKNQFRVKEISISQVPTITELFTYLLSLVFSIFPIQSLRGYTHCLWPN